MTDSAHGGTVRSGAYLAVFVAPEPDAHAAQLAVARLAARQLETDAIDVVLLNTAPISIAGHVLGTWRVPVDRNPHTRHRYESSTARLSQDFRIREHRLLAERMANG